MTLLRRVPALLLILAAAAGCGRSEKPRASAPAGVMRYPVSGVIRAVETARPEITLEHGPIEGLMGAMTMPFPIRGEAAGLSSLRVGDRIEATLVVDGGRFWLEGIRVTAQGAAAPDQSHPAGPTPASGVVTPRPNRGVAIGDAIPDFTLTDQTGASVRLSQFAGQPVAVTFLYTRCPVATACPLTTAKFSKLDAMLKEKGFGELLTITVDPEHDTPKVLAEYAKGAGANPKRWKFLTGDPRAVADVAERFGVLYYPDGGQIVHAQAVAVLDPQGRLSNIYYGEGWEPEHIFRDMEKARKG
jgi:protein SCO1/2